MTGYERSIQAFIDLVEEESGLFSDHWADLKALTGQMTDSDEEIAKALEEWLESPSRSEILNAYDARLVASSPLSASKSKTKLARSKSPTEPGERSQSSKKLLENAIQINERKSPSPGSPPAKP